MFVGLALFPFSSISNALLPVLLLLLLLLFLSLFLVALTLQSWHCYSAFQLDSPKAEATLICTHKLKYCNSVTLSPVFFLPDWVSYFSSAYAYTKTSFSCWHNAWQHVKGSAWRQDSCCFVSVEHTRRVSLLHSLLAHELPDLLMDFNWCILASTGTWHPFLMFIVQICVLTDCTACYWGWLTDQNIDNRNVIEV